MKDCKPCDDTTSGLEDGLRALINAQLQLGKELLKFLGDAGSDAMGGMSKLRLPKGSSCCDIPEPCWMPLPLGEIRCTLKPGDSGTVCLVVTNEDFRPQHYLFAATGKSAAHVSFSQTSATLQPKERLAVTATFTVPKDDRRGEDCRCLDHDVVVWVRGCRNHYLRWVIDEMSCSKPCCHEVEVHDQPDYVLHWYDHFYIVRPCFGEATTPGHTTGSVR